MDSRLIIDGLAACVGAACQNFSQILVDADTCTQPYFGALNNQLPMSPNNTIVGQNNNCAGDVLNPFLMMFSNGYSQYSNRQACCSSASFFNPLCSALLVICIIYAWVRVAVTIFNYLFIYRKKISPELESLMTNNDKIDENLKNEVNDFRFVLRSSYVVDFLNALFGWWFFKGVQYYASLNYPQNVYNSTSLTSWPLNVTYENTTSSYVTDSLCLYKQDIPPMMYIAVIIWFIVEVLSLWIQIFAVSSLTHLESYRYQGSNFYKKHRNWSLTWALLFSLVGGALLILHFTISTINAKDTATFASYKLYFKYYSESTLTFWLCFCLVFILVLTDRYLAYEGFKKREKEGPRRKDDQPNITSFLECYKTELNPDTIREELNKKFPSQEAENEKLANEIVGIYKEKMEKHIDEIKRMIRGLNDQGNHQTSMKYIIYLLIFNVTNLVGYIFMLVAYKKYTLTNDPAANESGLSYFLVGFIITSLATFSYELSHNYLFYKHFFGPVLEFWKKSSVSWN